MKTPEEIKKGLECRSKFDHCKGHCPYDGPGNSIVTCTGRLSRDALSHIQQLESELEAVKRERDAAVKDLGQVIYGVDWGIDCEYCKHKDKTVCESCEWEWRGACQDNAEERNDLL